MSDTITLIEIPEIYDGWSARLMVDGTIENRWDQPAWRVSFRYYETQKWINANGDALRAEFGFETGAEA